MLKNEAMDKMMLQPEKVNTAKSSSFFKPTIQKKLTVGSANDTYEVEADAMANKVMRMQEPQQQNVSHTGALLQRKCAACEQEEKLRMKPLAEGITPLIQRSSTENGSKSHAPSHVENQINSSRGGGSVMGNSTKNFMESRFGTDFSDVKIHTGSQAVQMSRELNAQAFTVGNDVYFNEGKYSPNTDSGKHLLAHELTHTVQQGGGIGRKVQRDYATDVSNPSAVFEGFNGEEIDDAIAFNQGQRYSTRDIGLYRDVLGLDSEPTIIDEDFINAIGEYQAQNNLGVDGKMRLGGETARRLARELRAEGRYLRGSEGAELIAANKRLCPNGMKTISVDFIRLSGSTLSPSTEIANANSIFRSCCIRFVIDKNVSITLPTTQSWLGGDTDVNASGITCAATTAEEKQLYDGATLAHALSSRMRVFLVNTFSGYGAAGFSRPPYCGGGYSNHVILSNIASGATNPLAHEFGHILLNSGVHSASPNLMAPSGGTVLDPTQCATCFTNA